MPYVRRDADGRISSLHLASEPGTEFVEGADTAVQAFGESAGVHNAADARLDFSRLDAEFVRVLEDVIDALIVRNLINITDLPEQAQAKLFARKTFRERVSTNSLQLLAPTDFGDVI